MIQLTGKKHNSARSELPSDLEFGHSQSGSAAWVGHASACQASVARPSELRSDAQGRAFLENRRGAGNLARSRLSGGYWIISELWCSAEGRLKAGGSQDWLPHNAAHIFIIRCDAPWAS